MATLQDEVVEQVHMNTRKRSFIFFIFFSLILFFLSSCFSSDVEISPPRFIAHAGGAINNQTYTNSLEALQYNYKKGFKFFEIDFSWTSDGELVAIHDWEDSFQRVFNFPEGMGIPTKKEFLQIETKTGLTQLSLEDILKWAEKQNNVFIITDIKDDNVKALKKISDEFEKQKQYIIPQVYNFKEFGEAKKLGFYKIILTLYKFDKINPYELLSFSKTNSPFAITMHWRLAQSGLAKFFAQNNVVVYAHTVNNDELFSTLKKIGVYGIYTDTISPMGH
jgi:glycerophosphoryl diester phosphodiesterase